MGGTETHRSSRNIRHLFIPAHAGNRTAARLGYRAVPVHPRACGEQAINGTAATMPTGSSPRVRGTGDCFRSTYGNPLVHPRACGEQRDAALRFSRPNGSSPRVRGTGIRAAERRIAARFIPARAGNRRPAIWGKCSRRGSSPRVRGTVGQGADHAGAGRFIPARAGNRLAVGQQSPAHAGSSPRVRGTVHHLDGILEPGRFIPARAGNSGYDGAGHAAPPVHPRACGEQESVEEFGHQLAGSSPRVRGTEMLSAALIGAKRFIPARAGNRNIPLDWSKSPPVHPRACGEQPEIAARVRPNVGSSPRVRGTDEFPVDPVLTVRFIPARAGNR